MTSLQMKEEIIDDGNAPTTVSPVTVGYSRYDQEKFGQNASADFQIETGLTFTGK